MSDESANGPANGPAGGPAGGAAGAGAGDAPGQQAQPNVRMLAHFVRDLSFENVGAIQGTPVTGQPEINVAVNLEAQGIGENRYQILMKTKATATSESKTRFLVEMEYAGVFAIENVKQEHLHPFIFIECPRQLLPFARRVIADVTRDGGYPPLMIDNVDFATLYRQRLEQLRAEGGQQPAPGGAGGAGTAGAA